MPDMSQMNLPPQVMQLLQQQQQSGGQGIEAMLAQLQGMSPDQVAQAIQQMFGVQVSGEEVEAAAETWLEQAGDAQTSAGSDTAAEGGEEDAQPPSDEAQSSPSDQQAEVAEPTPDDEGEEGELPSGATPTGYSGGASGGVPSSGVDPRMAAMLAAQGGGGAMPRGPSAMPPGVPGGSMDDLVSASMMQQAVGNPNARVPTGPRGPIPSPQASGGPPNSGRMAATIADLYRSTGGKKNRRPQAPSAKPAKPKND